LIRRAASLADALRPVKRRAGSGSPRVESFSQLSRPNLCCGWR